MLVVAGLTLKNLQPRVWDPESPYYLPDLRAVMVSYAELHKMPRRRKEAMKLGLRTFLGAPAHVRIFLDNGAFHLNSRGLTFRRDRYETFVRHAQPDWYAVPRDYIPTPAMTDDAQRRCLERTMAVNRRYAYDGFVPVIHASRLLDDYLTQLRADARLRRKQGIGLGGLVPNLLRTKRAVPYQDVLQGLRRVRSALDGKQLHVFGLGGTATLHLAALLGIDSLDSSGWRNRAAYGLVQLPGRGDRMVIHLGKWRGRAPSEAEWKLFAACQCPACQQFGIEGLMATDLPGFCNRATHNLWILLREAEQIQAHRSAGSYPAWYERHLDNSIYLPLIRETLKHAES